MFIFFFFHSSVLAWRIPGMAESGGLPSVGSHRVGHDWSDLAAAKTSNGWASFHGFTIHCVSFSEKCLDSFSIWKLGYLSFFFLFFMIEWFYWVVHILDQLSSVTQTFMVHNYFFQFFELSFHFYVITCSTICCCCCCCLNKRFRTGKALTKCFLRFSWYYYCACVCVLIHVWLFATS